MMCCSIPNRPDGLSSQWIRSSRKTSKPFSKICPWHVSDKGLYVTINYKVVDIDGFELGSSSQSEWVKAEKYTTIQNTLVVPFNDIGRIGGGSQFALVVGGFGLEVGKYHLFNQVISCLI